jgi:glycosyltransferase involved in cell wall biosynthesis
MEHLTTLAIGIPAFNEEKNILHLLKAILQQNTTGFTLEKIIVVSDGSTDHTATLAQSLSDERLTVITNKKRQGQNKCQNIILRSCQQDVVVLLNADVLPASDDFLTLLTQPLRQDSRVGLASAETIPVPPITSTEKILYPSHLLKNALGRDWNGGKNVLSSHGAARAFSKKFYQKISWPDTVPEDAYSFFRCLQLQQQFVFEPKAQVLMRLPQSLSDHIQQSHRYFLGHKRLGRYFPPRWIRQNYQIPRFLFGSKFLTTWFSYPWQMSVYVLMMIGVNYLIPKQVSHASRFTMATSSKRLIL